MTDMIHIDEEIDMPAQDQLIEWFARLADYKGQMVWSEYPRNPQESDDAQDKSVEKPK